MSQMVIDASGAHNLKTTELRNCKYRDGCYVIS
jgi:hypothetical protein